MNNEDSSIETTKSNIIVNTGDTVPLSMYRESEWRLQRTYTNIYEQKLKITELENTITSLFREIATYPKLDDAFIDYLMAKYSLVNLTKAPS